MPSGDQAGGLGNANALVCTSSEATVASGPWAGWSSYGSSMIEPVLGVDVGDLAGGAVVGGRGGGRDQEQGHEGGEDAEGHGGHPCGAMALAAPGNPLVRLMNALLFLPSREILADAGEPVRGRRDRRPARLVGARDGAHDRPGAALPRQRRQHRRSRPAHRAAQRRGLRRARLRLPRLRAQRRTPERAGHLRGRPRGARRARRRAGRSISASRWAARSRSSSRSTTRPPG